MTQPPEPRPTAAPTPLPTRTPGSQITRPLRHPPRRHPGRPRRRPRPLRHPPRRHPGRPRRRPRPLHQPPRRHPGRHAAPTPTPSPATPANTPADRIRETGRRHAHRHRVSGHRPAHHLARPAVRGPRSEQVPAVRRRRCITRRSSSRAKQAPPTSTHMPAKACSCPLLKASTRSNGASLIGALVQVYTSDDREHVYQITRVKRHALDF